MTQEARRAAVSRKTKETDITLTLAIDGSGTASVQTGIGFFDHMLELFAHHGRFDLDLRARGDLDVDGHHTVEDVGLVMGQAFAEALGDKRGITRYAWCALPMDEALALVAVDISGRPFLVHDLELGGVRIGSFDAELTGHFLRSFVTQAGITLHVRLLSGEDSHHIVEAVFKGVARALAAACARHGRSDEIPSTKGTL
jgi:imidazoleglycerol-phosphate dehydratase